jgi:hypothetical protein
MGDKSRSLVGAALHHYDFASASLVSIFNYEERRRRRYVVTGGQRLHELLHHVHDRELHRQTPVQRLDEVGSRSFRARRVGAAEPTPFDKSLLTTQYSMSPRGLRGIRMSRFSLSAYGRPLFNVTPRV